MTPEEKRARALSVFKFNHLDKIMSPTPAERELLNKWMQGVDLDLLLYGRTVVASFPDQGTKETDTSSSSKVPYVIKIEEDTSDVIKKVTREYTPSAHSSKGLTFEDMVLRGLHRYSPATIAKIRIKEERERREKNKRRKEG